MRHTFRRGLPLLATVSAIGLGILSVKYYSFARMPAALDRYSLQLGCSLYDTRLKKRRSYPGWTCLFVPDTDLVIASAHNGTSGWRRNGELVWNQPMVLHHQINPARDGKSVLSLGYEVRTEANVRVRTDTAVHLDLQGRVIKKIHFSEHTEKLFSLHQTHPRRRTLGAWNWGSAVPLARQADVEDTHANSIYEIGPNALEASLPSFRRGNYIVNFYRPPITVILDEQMKEILWTFSEVEDVGPQISASGFHDVQVSPNGNLLVYLNYDYGCQNGRSSLHEINPLTRAREWTFCPKSGPRFFGQAMGGLQLLGDGLVLTSQSREISNGHVESHVIVGDSHTQETVFRAETSALQPSVQQARLINDVNYRPIPAGMVRSAMKAADWRRRLKKVYSRARTVPANP